MLKSLHLLKRHILPKKLLLICMASLVIAACTTKRDTHEPEPVDRGYPSVHTEAQPYFDIDARSVVGTGATIIERNLLHALTSLRLIAATPATRSGIWPEIMPALQQLCKVIPGAALYIQPDGNYYSVEKGFTGLNLSDRPYFNPLFNGEEIYGTLIHSRSTGKKSVLLAVPSFENGEVTGAVALSIFLDDFQQLLSDAMQLEPGYLWYVLDEGGNTVLHPRADFVFLNPAEHGSPSMIHAVEKITSGEKGYTSYKFAGRNTHILYQKIPFNNWRMILGKIGEATEEDFLPEAYEVLTELKTIIYHELTNMDNDLDRMVEAFEGEIPPRHIVRNSFLELYENNPYVVSCALIDPQGTIVYAEPPDFHPSEGKSIRDQESYLVMQKNRAPMLSNSFLAVEGFDAVSLHYPITDPKGEFHGSVSIMIRPDVMVAELASPAIVGTMFEPWIMEPDGRILFDKAYGGTGRMLYLDYLYEEMRTFRHLGDNIATNKTGQGDYIHHEPETNESSVKLAIWDTIELHNTEWRIIISYPPYE